MTEPTLILTPRRPALLAGFDNQVDVLVRLQAPDAPEMSHRRSNLNIALVLDRSGSMSGQPLQDAKRCARFVIDRLGPADRASLVVYDDQIAVPVPSTPAGDRALFHRAIQGIESGGMTNLHGGWLAGAEQVSEHIAPDTITRVILLSDGQANRGVTDIDRIAAQCAELARTGVTTSTYGLGRSFNEDLMIQMARAGQGNAYYGQTADDLMDPFQEEFDLLSALFARRVRVMVSSPLGVPVSLLNQLPRDPSGAYILPDLAYSGEAWAVARLTIDRSTFEGGSEDNALKILKVSAVFDDLDGNTFELSGKGLDLPVLPAAAWETVAEDDLVARRVAELEAANIQDQAQQAARHGDWEEVKRLLAQAKGNAKDNPWLEEVVDRLSALAKEGDEMRFAKETMYQSTKMRSRLAASAETAELSEEAPTYLRRKAEQGKGRRS